MSDPQEIEDIPPMNEVDTRAADWVQRRQFWNWSDSDQARLDDWLAESMAHRVAYWRLKAAYARTDRLAALRRPANEKSARFRFSPLLTSIAAAAVIAVIGGAVIANYSLRPQDRTYVTPVGGHQIVSFADGSKIELNTNTAIRARMTTEQRTIWLDRGEAYFQVKHDAAHPFVVMIGDRRVTDLGTRFIIRRQTGQTEIAVVQGAVRFDAPDVQSSAQIAMLRPGDVAMVTADSMSITKRSSNELGKELSWRHGVVVFNRTTLADAASEFNRYNVRKIVIADPAAASLAIDGTFSTTDEAAFIDAARTIFGLRVNGKGRDIVISR
ncbi:MAG TPA: FecR domain-containing protein [Rhizomicrobium sp.]|nr:FecR domain-containing protein [Rhizomicrobium sp.]